MIKTLLITIACIAAVALIGCKQKNAQSTSVSSNTTAVSESDQVEKSKPAPGTGNVQGKVLYNSKPAANVEVKLCETFNQYFGGCGGKTYTARTDSNGEYVITNVPPKTYEGLLARVFDTDTFIFAAAGLAGLSSTKYDIVPDKTFFVAPTNLFKTDLKLVNPKAGAKVNAQNLELKWEAYPDAAYYKFSIYPEETSVMSPYVNERIDGTSFGIDKPLGKGSYRWQVVAYNSADKKLAESGDDIKFIVN